MEDKLAVGMYVRLNCNYALGIGKIIGEIDEDNFIKTKFKDGFECSLPTYMIKKASRNIIDLIEVGDYVNGHKVEIISDEIFDEIYGVSGKHLGYADDTEMYDFKRIYNKDIKSIVTKEMFENISYEVE